MNQSTGEKGGAGPAGLMEQLGVLVKRRRLIGLITGGALVLSLVVSLLIPNKYAASARLLPPEQQLPMGIAALSGLPLNLGGVAESLLGRGGGSRVWMDIVMSDTAMDAIIGKFGLMELYDEDKIEDARKALEKRMTVEFSKTGVLLIEVKDEDPLRAAGMANAFVDELDRINKQLSMSSGKRMRVFVEGRLLETKQKLDEADEAIKKFQEKNSAVSLSEQSVAVIEAIGTLKAQLIAKEVELKTLQSYAAPGNPQLGILTTQAGELRRELSKLEKGTDTAGGGDVFIPTSRIPSLAQQYARLLREIKIQSTLYELLVGQYEQARILEAKDSPTVQVLDRALPPTKKASPKRALIVLVSTALAFALSSMLAFYLEYSEVSAGGNGGCSAGRPPAR